MLLVWAEQAPFNQRTMQAAYHDYGSFILSIKLLFIIRLMFVILIRCILTSAAIVRQLLERDWYNLVSRIGLELGVKVRLV